MRATDTFAQFLRDDIAPALRVLGFRGSGRRYYLPDSDHYVVVTFQTARTRMPDRIKFTVLTGIVDKERWDAARAADPSLPQVPSAIANYGLDLGVWRRPVGSLVDGHDRWWMLDSAGTRRDLLATEVVGAIGKVVVPAVRARLAAG